MTQAHIMVFVRAYQAWVTQKYPTRKAGENKRYILA